MENLAKHLINFYAFIQHYSFELPSDIKSIQPYKGEVFENIRSFFTTYYSDTKPRSLILGINPGRKGAGVTGLPFTDSKRLQGLLNHKVSNQKQSYEPSSEFFYKAISQYGGPKKFYTDFICSFPLKCSLIEDKKEFVHKIVQISLPVFEYIQEGFICTYFH